MAGLLAAWDVVPDAVDQTGANYALPMPGLERIGSGGGEAKAGPRLSAEMLLDVLIASVLFTG